MDPIETNNKNVEKNRLEDINRRYNEIVRKWSEVPDQYKTIFKIIPIFIILAAIPLTVRLTQQQQYLNSNAAQTTVNVPSTIDATGNTDVSNALNTFVASVPDGSIILFPTNAIYRLDTGIQFSNRQNLIFEGNGTTLKTGSASSGADQLTSLFVLGHTYNGYWGGTNNNITIHNFTLVGNNVTPGIFTSGQEGQSGMEIEGSNNVTIYNVNVKGVWSDGFKIGDASNTVRIYNSHVIDAGRNGVSTISGSNIEIDHNAFDKIGYVVFDIEPNTSSQSNTNQTFHDNTFGTWGAEFFALDGSHTGASIHDITVNNNVGTGRSLLTFVNNGGITRNTNIVFTNNKSSISASGPVLNFAYVDSLIVTGNIQPLGSGSLTSITNSTNVVTTAAVPTSAPTPTNNPTITPTSKPTLTPTSTPTPTPKPTNIQTPTLTITPKPTVSLTPTPTIVNTAFLTINSITVSNITKNSADVSWYLSQPATGQVQYGTSTSYGLYSLLEPSYLTYHKQTLSNLTPGTTYHFRVISKNSSAVSATSSDSTFKTVTNLTPTPTPIKRCTKILSWKFCF